MMPNQMPSDDPVLDALLDTARWPEMSAESHERLRRQWLRNRSHSRWPAILSTISVAAVVVLAASLWLVNHTSKRPLERVVKAPKPLVIVEASPSNNPYAGRPATPLEVAMLRLAEKRLGKSVKPSTVAPSAQPPDPVREVASNPVNGIDPIILADRAILANNPQEQRRLIGELVAQGPARCGQAMLNVLGTRASESADTDLRSNSAVWTDCLFASLDDGRIAVRQSAVRILAEIDGPQTTARLEGMVNHNIHRREAIAALVHIRSTDAKDFLAAAARSPDFGGIVLSAMLQHSSPPSLQGTIQ
jgi:hypothetical protein